jgi:hypothetical protein
VCDEAADNEDDLVDCKAVEKTDEEGKDDAAGVAEPAGAERVREGARERPPVGAEREERERTPEVSVVEACESEGVALLLLLLLLLLVTVRVRVLTLAVAGWPVCVRATALAGCLL